MQLNNVQEASLRRLQRYRTHPPTLGERVRLSLMFILGLLVIRAVVAAEPAHHRLEQGR